MHSIQDINFKVQPEMKLIAIDNLLPPTLTVCLLYQLIMIMHFYTLLYH